MHCSHVAQGLPEEDACSYFAKWLCTIMHKTLTKCGHTHSALVVPGPLTPISMLALSLGAAELVGAPEGTPSMLSSAAEEPSAELTM